MVTGNSCDPIRATVSVSRVTAFSWLTIEPCPARPCAVSCIHEMPFSAASIRYSRSWSLTVKLKPPTSPIATPTPSKRSGRLATSHCDPNRPPASSSAKEREHQRTTRLASRSQPVSDDRQDHGVHVLHVDGAASPHHRDSVVIVDLGRERRVCPVIGVGRHDVEVPV